MNIYQRRHTRVVALVLILCLSLGQGSAESALSRVETPKSQAGQILEPLAQWMHQKESASGADLPEVFLIQDIHGDFDAQQKIFQTILYLRENANATHVLFEGSHKNLELSFLQTYPDKRFLEESLMQFASGGDLDAVELASALGPQPIHFEGMDHRAKYQINRRLLLRSKEPKALLVIQNEIQLLKQTHYSKELLELDLIYQQYLMDRMLRESTLQRLMDFAHQLGLDTDHQYSEIDWLRRRLALQRELEESTGTSIAEITEGLLVLRQNLRHVTRDKSRNELSRALQEYQSQSNIQRLAKIIALANQEDVLPSSLVPFSFLSSDENPWNQGIRLDASVENLILALMRGLADGAMTSILEASLRLEMLRKLSRLQLNRREVELFLKHPEHAQEASLVLLLEPFHLKPFHFNLSNQINFYKMALSRERNINQRVVKEVKKMRKNSGRDNSSERLIVKLGGFHAEGLIDVLVREGITYQNFVPAIREKPDPENYLRLMRREYFWRAQKNKLFSNRPISELEGRALEAWKANLIDWGFRHQGMTSELSLFLEQTMVPSASYTLAVEPVTLGPDRDVFLSTLGTYLQRNLLASSLGSGQLTQLQATQASLNANAYGASKAPVDLSGLLRSIRGEEDLATSKKNLIQSALGQVSWTMIGGKLPNSGNGFLIRFGDHAVLLDAGFGAEGLKLLKSSLGSTKLDAVILSHAHTDHADGVPWLHENYPDVPILATEATFRILKPLWDDAIRFRSRDTSPGRRQNQQALDAMTIVENGKWLQIGANFKFFLDAVDHIPGATSVTLMTPSQKILYSGDLGGKPSLTQAEDVDLMISEATNGGRRFESMDERAKYLVNEASQTLNSGGVVLIPAFAVGRTAIAARILDDAIQEGLLPANTRIYVDGMAQGVIQQLRHVRGFRRERDWFTTGSSVHSAGDEDQKRVWLKKAIAGKAPTVIIAGSGMLAGGSSVRYLRDLIGNPRHKIIFTGYQASGTRGQLILSSGAGVQIRFKGSEKSIVKGSGGQRQKDVTIELKMQVADGRLSGHVDHDGIVQVIRDVDARQVLLIHGSDEAKEALREDPQLKEQKFIPEPKAGTENLMPQQDRRDAFRAISAEILPDAGWPNLEKRIDEYSEVLLSYLTGDQSSRFEMKYVKDVTESLTAYLEDAQNLVELEFKIDVLTDVYNNVEGDPRKIGAWVIEFTKTHVLRLSVAKRQVHETRRVAPFLERRKEADLEGVDARQDPIEAIKKSFALIQSRSETKEVRDVIEEISDHLFTYLTPDPSLENINKRMSDAFDAVDVYFKHTNSFESLEVQLRVLVNFLSQNEMKPDLLADWLMRSTSSSERTSSIAPSTNQRPTLTRAKVASKKEKPATKSRDNTVRRNREALGWAEGVFNQYLQVNMKTASKKDYRSNSEIDLEVERLLGFLRGSSQLDLAKTISARLAAPDQSETEGGLTESSRSRSVVEELQSVLIDEAESVAFSYWNSIIEEESVENQVGALRRRLQKAWSQNPNKTWKVLVVSRSGSEDYASVSQEKNKIIYQQLFMYLMAQENPEDAKVEIDQAFDSSGLDGVLSIINQLGSSLGQKEKPDQGWFEVLDAIVQLNPTPNEWQRALILSESQDDLGSKANAEAFFESPQKSIKQALLADDEKKFIILEDTLLSDNLPDEGSVLLDSLVQANPLFLIITEKGLRAQKGESYLKALRQVGKNNYFRVPLQSLDLLSITPLIAKLGRNSAQQGIIFTSEIHPQLDELNNRGTLILRHYRLAARGVPEFIRESILKSLLTLGLREELPDYLTQDTTSGIPSYTIDVTKFVLTMIKQVEIIRRAA